MANPFSRRFISAVAVMCFSIVHAEAQSNFINASQAVYNSSGTVYGTTVTFTQNGYIGSFVSLGAPSVVSFSVVATGLSGTNGIPPTMSLLVDDTKRTWSVGSVASSYTITTALPAGTHLVRIQFDNALKASGAELNISSVQVKGAIFANSSDPNVLNSNSLGAADTYIRNFRQGTTTLNLSGIAAKGARVQISLVRHAFRFGEEVPGTDQASVDTYLAPNPAPGSTAAIYQEHFLPLFNSVVPGNMGKWAYDEATRGAVTMQGVDDILSFAEANHLRARMHNLIWGSQQPNFTTELALAAETPTVSGVNNPVADMMSAIQYRIGYYVQDRASHYDALDVYNESVHTGAWQTGDVQTGGGCACADYWNIFGVSGIASIYSQVAQAANQAGNPKLKLFTNEYNVLVNSATPPGTNGNTTYVNDPYANWYRQHVESILSAGGAVSAIGSEYYATEKIANGDNSSHNASRIEGVFNNLAVLGLPIELTEFGIQAPSGGGQNTAIDSQILNESMRLTFGNPAVQGFTMFGFWAGDVWSQAPNAVLYDSNWNLTPAGQTYLNLMQQWNTQVSTTVSKGSSVSFAGFYGDYTLTTGEKTYTFSLVKGARGSPGLTLLQ
jgi:endo-1,4-beta-xylanase